MSFTRNDVHGSMGVLGIVSEIDPGKDCGVHHVLIKDTRFKENVNPSDEIMATAVVIVSAKPTPKVRVTLNTINVTFWNVSFAGHAGHGYYYSSDEDAVIYVQHMLSTTFIDCTFVDNTQAVISARDTTLVFKGYNVFRNNSANYGTGIQLFDSSYIYLKDDTYILFADNHADRVGGAIYSENSHGFHFYCFFQIEHNRSLRIDFHNNTANIAGSSMYAPQVANCRALLNFNENIFHEIFNISNTESDPSAISSAPFGVCWCKSGHRMPSCDHNYQHISAYPGEEFTLRMVVVGRAMYGAVPGVVRANFTTTQIAHQASFGLRQESQTNKIASCNDFTYSVFSTLKYLTFQVRAESSLDDELDDALDSYTIPNVSVHMHLKDCPPGFSLSNSARKCVCDPVIRKSGIQCYINNQSILRPANTWIGFYNDPHHKTGVMFHDHCPYGYCSSQSVNVTISDPDIQCENNRTGLLCGQCREDYSLTLDSQKCSKCSNLYLLLLLPLAVSGLVLVAVLFLLNMTVADGSINCLIFYANVVAITHSSLNPVTSSGLYIFIAWLNLDLGIDTCLFDGMDAYTEMWLQFVFPFYLWAIIIAIVMVSNKIPSRLTRRIGGENAVKVLATLLLLSYTKLQRAVITIFTFTSLTYPSGAVRHVWSYDANVEFPEGKHLYLYIAGMLVLVFLILPYTFVLTFFQYLQACSTRRVFRWVNMLKPVFDAYAGPYKDRYRVWTGLLLIARTLLIVLFSLGITDSPDFYYFTVLIMSLILLAASSGGIYKKWPCNVLESFFYLQLGVLSGTMLYASQNIPVVADISTGMVLSVFLAVVGYHAFSVSCLRKFHCCSRRSENPEEDPLISYEREPVVPPIKLRRPSAK